MPQQDSLATLDAVAQAELVQKKELTPLELVDAAIARIQRLDPVLGAVVCPLFEQARTAARGPLPAGPFRGVPFLMKDVGATQAGQPHYMGNRALRDLGHRAPRDTYLGARFRRAGLVTVGKSKIPEFGLQSTTQPLAFGPAHNPWDLTRSPSGSSGGAAAAVAAGLVPIAHANDGAGSIRLPAAWCGLVGLKPSRGRVALEPTWIGRSFVGFALTRSVRDAAVLLDAVHGNEPGDLFVLAEPARPYRSQLGTEPGRLRIGLLAEMGGASLHPECRAAVEDAGRRLEALGHRIEIAWPEALFEEQRAVRTLAFGPLEYRMCLRTLAGLLGRPVEPDDVEPYLWTLAGLDWPPVLAEDYLDAAEWRQGWAVRVASWWSDGFDLLLTPTVCEPPALLSELSVDPERPWDLLERIGPHMTFTEPFNVTGQPTISLPLHWTPQGLPVGIQLVAAIGREDLLLSVASQLEREAPWSGRRPPIHA
jgi:amidase